MAPPADARLRLETVRLTALYGRRAVVKDVSILFPAHTVTAVIGPSGCGKSTFLRCLNRMHELSDGGWVTGSALLDGADVYDAGVDPVQLRRRIGMVLQRPTPFPTITSYGTVARGSGGLHYRAVRTTTSLSDSLAVTGPGRKPGDPGLATGVRVVRPSHRAASIIDARAYRFWYGGTQAPFDLTFTIPRRAVTALIGPSGCGKSTFLRSVNRLNELIPGTRHSGDILLEGVSVFSRGMDAVALRREVGMVFQRPNPFPKSIFDNVAYGPRLNALAPERDIPERVERALRQAALWDEVQDRLEAPGTSLSGGQQQRLCIARTLANEPEVLLMDEPCSALDPAATKRIEEVLVELKQRYSIVIVTHNMQQASRVSDLTGFFYLGHLIEFGDTKQLFTRPADERTEAYITGRFG